MFNTLKNLAQSGVDLASSKAASVFIQNMLGDAGTVKEMKIDSKAKTVTFSAQLKGEAEIVTCKVLEYETQNTADGATLIIRKISTSKPWLQILFNKHLCNAPIEIPPTVAKLL